MRLKWWRVLLIYKGKDALIIIIQKSRLSKPDTKKRNKRTLLLKTKAINSLTPDGCWTTNIQKYLLTSQRGKKSFKYIGTTEQSNFLKMLKPVSVELKWSWEYVWRTYYLPHQYYPQKCEAIERRNSIKNHMFKYNR